MTYQNKKARSARTRCSTYKFRARPAFCFEIVYWWKLNCLNHYDVLHETPEILRAYILLRVCVNVSEILLLSFNRNCILVETELSKILRYVLMNTLSPNNSEDECQQVNLFYTIPKIKYCL